MNPEPASTETEIRLARLAPGKFQRLGDLVLPELLPELQGLQAHGINDEDRTTKGVPDSYVGESPERCTVAVEYNSWAGRLEQKFGEDLEGVLKECPRAALIVLVAARHIDGLNLDALEQRAANAGRSLVLVCQAPRGWDRLRATI